MWNKFKTLGNLYLRICLAALFISFILLVFFTLVLKDLNQNAQLITNISLVMMLLSLPSIIDLFAKEYNPKKKSYKLSCKCPKCQHLIQMDMKEE